MNDNKTATQKNVLAFGGGVDSTALLALHLNRTAGAKLLGISRRKLDKALPNFSAVVFSDPGAEFQHTYKNIEQARELCEKAGLEFVTVRREGETITEWVKRLGIVPVMPGGPHVCSLKFKGEVMAKWASDSYGSSDRVTWSVGIEHNEGARVTRFTAKRGTKSQSVFPLVTLKIDRDKCREIIAALWPIEVMKSSCVFCPFMQSHEIEDLTKCGDEFATALEVEDRFEQASAEKNGRWIKNGRPLNKGGRAPKGMWRINSYASGARLFAKKVDGRQLSVREWAEKVA